VFNAFACEDFSYEIGTEHVDVLVARSVGIQSQKALKNGRDYWSEFRILQSNLPSRWISARGRVEFNGSGLPVRMCGVSIDITERKQAETELRQNREELAHVNRAQAAQRFLDHGNWSTAEFREILQDIADDGKRAGEVIRSMRNMGQEGSTCVGTP
jgi:hypothetical protein